MPCKKTECQTEIPIKKGKGIKRVVKPSLTSNVVSVAPHLSMVTNKGVFPLPPSQH